MGEDDVQKKINPVLKANVFSLCTFGYTLELFKKGYEKDIDNGDLYGLSKGCQSETCGKSSESDWAKCNGSLLKIFLKRYGYQYLFFLIVVMSWTELQSILHPYASSRLISYFGRNQTEISKSEAVTCGGILIFLNYLRYFFWKNLHVYEIHVAINMCTSIKSLLYRKALRMSIQSTAEMNIGNMVTLLTKDIYIIEDNPWVYLDLVVAIVQTVTGLYLLWAKTGDVAYLGIGLLLIALPLQSYLSWIAMRMRLTVAKKSDERNQIIQEVLSALKVVKAYVWENFFIEKIAKTRKKEIGSLINVFFVKFIVVGIGMLSSRLTFLMLIVFYLYLGNTPDTETLFYILAIFQQMATGLSINIPSDLSTAAQIQASLKRINRVLQLDEDFSSLDHIPMEKNQGNPFLIVNTATVKIKNEFIVKGICLNIYRKGLTIITGPVGSGKSSLLRLLLKDFVPCEGNVIVNGTMSYASQEPWLFPSSIKQNILFGDQYNQRRYREIIRCSALDYDLSCLEKYDETLVLDRGQNLSKGQQARISLARAAYRKCDIYLIDDSLASLDQKVQEFIFNETITKLLENKIVIMVSQNERHIKRANTVIVLEKGGIASIREQKFATEELLSDGTEFSVTDTNIRKVINETKNYDSEYHKVYNEIKKQGKVDPYIYKSYFQLGGGVLLLSIIIFLYTLAQYFESYSDKLLTSWIELQHDTRIVMSNISSNNNINQEKEEEKEYTFNMYFYTTLFQAGFGLIKFYIFLMFCRKASLNIHEGMMKKIIGAPLSLFDNHFVGNLLNRFSFDINNIDENLPFLFPQLTSVIFSSIGSLILICTVSTWLMLPLSIIILLLIAIRMFAISSMRSLKRLEATTRSPLVGHINATLEGLTTIRAFNAEEIVIKEFNKHQDNYNSAIYTSQVMVTAFQFFMGLITSLATVIVVNRFLFFRHDMTVGDIGLAIGQVGLMIEMVQSVVIYWADLESNMTSVERTLEYTTIEQEKDCGGIEENWLIKGDIAFENVTLHYGSASKPVLKNVTFVVEDGQKIGIVGRTGAGKSSIISVIYRLYDYDGDVIIDRINTKTLSLNCLRKNIAIIPQDPILFSGSVRDNIDPNREYEDDNIWSAINKVRLQDVIKNLDAPVIQNGVGFSVGQKQLICLARAALRRNKIVILDEATANMDLETEDMLYRVIDDVFSECTILIIAHRLEYIQNCDKVIIFDAGVVEYYNTQILGNNGSLFSKMQKNPRNEHC